MGADNLAIASSEHIAFAFHICLVFIYFRGLPRWCYWQRTHCQCRKCKRRGFDPWIGKIPWRRTWQPTPLFLPGESHGQTSLAGYSPMSRKESDRTEVTWPAQAFCLISWPLPSLLLSAGKISLRSFTGLHFSLHSTFHPIHCVFPM